MLFDEVSRTESANFIHFVYSMILKDLNFSIYLDESCNGNYAPLIIVRGALKFTPVCPFICPSVQPDID